MQHLTLLTLGLAAASSASSMKRQLQCSTDPTSDDCQMQEADYIQHVCNPANATGYPDFNAPCNQIQAITLQCMYGPAGLSALQGDVSDASYGSDDEDNSVETQSNSTQQECICQSQWFNIAAGCNDCYNAHGASGGDNIVGDLAPSLFASLSSSYCAVTNTPTMGFDEVLYGLATGSVASSLASVASTASPSTFSDPIGNQTAVSYYYTPSITGSAAWVLAQATSSATSAGGSESGSETASSSGSSETTSVATSNGQIVATAAAQTSSGSATGTASGASGTASTTSASAGNRVVVQWALFAVVFAWIGVTL
ncbi:hypothetical protein LTR56_024925 [Elasticomyces elasticus]|nr:hypothetical protein LTR56_024925 [Elasticomyces elasticus]KAK3641685.1 hypothetical protein LTR22_016503 [Elasticomyces elasticus]KAK4907965.1 hypothetical protein LTR49_023063 [Elasticomyces elasticus]KAK5741829.1 hypothetical protein LTS12_024465 [Elasticomyces elasticus]